MCIFEKLNTILTEYFTPYRPKHYAQHLIKILLDIYKIYATYIPVFENFENFVFCEHFSKKVFFWIFLGQKSKI